MSDLLRVKKMLQLYKAANMYGFNGQNPFEGDGAYTDTIAGMQPPLPQMPYNGAQSGPQQAAAAPGGAPGTLDPIGSLFNVGTGAMAAANPLAMPATLAGGLVFNGLDYAINGPTAWRNLQNTQRAMSFNPNKNSVGSNLVNTLHNVGYALTQPIDGARIAFNEMRKGLASRQKFFNGPTNVNKPIATTPVKPVQNTVAKPIKPGATGSAANPYLTR